MYNILICDDEQDIVNALKIYGNTAQKRVPDTAKCDIIKPWINK